MRAYVMTGPGEGGIQELPDPDPGPYDVVVEMLACGVCSSTDKMLRQGTFAMGVSYPSVLGHESVGRVVAVGDRVRAYRAGDLITRPSAYRPDGAPLNQHWGGFAERGIVTDWRAMIDAGEVPTAARPRFDQVRLPGDTDPAEAALSISLSETYSVIVRHDLLGRVVVVVGTGIAGLSMISYAKLLGAGTVIAVGRRQQRLDLATELGADRAVLAADAAAAVREAGGADYVFEASGQAAMIAESYRWLKRGGQEIIYSAPDSATELNLFTGPREAALSVASPNEAAVLPSILRLVRAGVIETDRYLTHRFPFAEIDAAFAAIAAGDVVKAMIMFDD